MSCTSGSSPYSLGWAEKTQSKMNYHVITRGWWWGGKESGFSHASFMLLFRTTHSSCPGGCSGAFVNLTGSPAKKATNCVLFWDTVITAVNMLFAFFLYLLWGQNLSSVTTQVYVCQLQYCRIRVWTILYRKHQKLDLWPPPPRPACRTRRCLVPLLTLSPGSCL